ncbi:MAG: hypothetical protein AB8B85_05685, partial [Paracoccaceae bacterium]
MGAAVQLRDDFDGPSLRALANGCRNGPQSRRLLALVEICDGARRSDAARLAGVGLQIIRDSLPGSTSRHAREGGDPFNAEGPDGLINRKGSGPPSRLDDAQWAALKKVVEDGPKPYRAQAVSGPSRIWPKPYLAQAVSGP